MYSLRSIILVTVLVTNKYHKNYGTDGVIYNFINVFLPDGDAESNRCREGVPALNIDLRHCKIKKDRRTMQHQVNNSERNFTDTRLCLSPN
jgi:hypothetical protein